jgi:hypothetical protein
MALQTTDSFPGSCSRITMRARMNCMTRGRQRAEESAGNHRDIAHGFVKSRLVNLRRCVVAANLPDELQGCLVQLELGW